MKRLFISLLVFLLVTVIPVNSLAACSEAVTLLPEGAASPCRGYLFTPEKEFQVFKDEESYKLLQVEFDNQSKIIEDNKKQLVNLTVALNDSEQKSQLWQTRAEEATKSLMKEDSNRGTRDLLFIGLGVVLTIGAGIAVGLAAKGLHN